MVVFQAGCLRCPTNRPRKMDQTGVTPHEKWGYNDNDYGYILVYIGI